MEAFAIIGMSTGTMGMIFGFIAFARLTSLEKALKESGVLSKDYK